MGETARMPEPHEHLEPRPGEMPEDDETSRLMLVASLLTVAAIVAMVLLITPLRNAITDALSGNTESLREDLNDLGATGYLVVLVLALAHSVIFYPAEILNAAVGYVYGFWVGLPLVMAGWMLNGILCHQIGNYGGRPLLLKLLHEDRFLRWERAVERGGPVLLMALRLIPIVPFSVCSYVLGSAGVPLRTFIWTTAIGYLPLTVIFVVLGSRLEDISPTDPVIWAGAIGMVLLLLVTRWVLPRIEHHGEEPAE